MVLPASASADSGGIALVEDAGGAIKAAAASTSMYLQKTACAFFKSHPQAFDAIIVFTSYNFTTYFTDMNAGWTVFQSQKGIGRDVYADQSAQYCSTAHRLKHAVKLADLNSLPDDPDDLYTEHAGIYLSGIQLLAHEFGHYWLAGADFKTADGVKHCCLRGFVDSGGGGGDCDGYLVSDFNQHWSFHFNSHSVMYGSFIEDLGNGTFRYSYPNPQYGPLDQYLMGLRVKSEVEPMFVVDLGALEPAGYPLAPGETKDVTGKRLDFTIDDVIRAMGPRVPERDPCHWKAAFIVVHPKGQPPAPAEIAKVDRYRLRWEEFYDWATDHRGSFDTTLSGSGPGTATCPASGVYDGGVPDAGTAADTGTPSDTGTTADAGVFDDAEAAADVSSGVDTAEGGEAAAEPDGEAAGRDSGTAVETDAGSAGEDDPGACSCATVSFGMRPIEP
jgi:hypothetical protein